MFKNKIYLFCILTTIISCNSEKTTKENQSLAKQTIYFGGDIITMDGDTPQYVEAVIERDGKIIYTGSKANAVTNYAGETIEVDLKGKTMLPGFLDPHGHFMFAIQMANQVNVALPPVGKITDIATIQNTLKSFQEERNIPEGEWVVGWGYDNEGLAEKRHVTKQDLDAVLPNHKVMIIHVSGHGAVLNSAALKWAKINDTTETPSGGIIARMEGSKEPAGLLMETAYLPVFSNLPKPTEEEMLDLMDAAQQMYASEGYVHAQDGFSHLKDIAFLRKAASKGKIYLDIISLPAFTEIPKIFKNPENFVFGTYEGNFKLQGIKFTQDGSPQGKTAFLSKPYLTRGLNGEENWKGETTQPKEDFISQFKQVADKGIQLFVHANGDAAIDQVIEATERAGLTANNDRRTVVIHSQIQRPDQLPKYKALGITPSYFTNHTFFWGEVHVRNIGKEAANFISPVKSATDLGLKYSNHTDFNVTPLDPFFVIWTAISRTSRTGQIIGANERVAAYTALQGLTTGPAYQIFEENRKGKIKEGFNANFVILNKNPIKVSTSEIKDIIVIETIKEGKTIYKK